jgi:hypothetical protein
MSACILLKNDSLALRIRDFAKSVLRSNSCVFIEQSIYFFYNSVIQQPVFARTVHVRIVCHEFKMCQTAPGLQGPGAVSFCAIPSKNPEAVVCIAVCRLPPKACGWRI